MDEVQPGSCEMRAYPTDILSEGMRQAMIFAVMAAVFGATAMLGGRSFDYWGSIQTVEMAEAPTDQHFDPSSPSVRWRAASLRGVEKVAGLRYYRVMYELPNSVVERGEPLALFLSGAMSAEVFWNGAPIGAKGKAAGTVDTEIPGPVDAVFHIPEDTLQAGSNEIILSLSSNHLHLYVRDLIHRFGVGPYRGDMRRPIGEYAAPLFLLGALMFGFAALAFHPGAGGYSRLQFLTLLVFASLAVMGVAEIARALINYSYPLHPWRVSVVVAGSFTLSMFLVATAVLVAKPPRGKWILLACAFALIAAGASTPYFDPRAARIVATGAGAAIAIGLRGLLQGRRGALILSISCFPLLIFALSDPSAFLDRLLYAASIPIAANLFFLSRRHAGDDIVSMIPMISNNLLFAPPTTDTASYHSDSKAGSTRLVVKTKGGVRYIPFGDILSIHGAGNYAELSLQNSERVLHNDNLSTLGNALPDVFFRTHRSHIINLDHVSAIRTLGSGKYSAELDNGAEVPVSRTRVANLRTCLDAASTA